MSNVNVVAGSRFFNGHLPNERLSRALQCSQADRRWNSPARPRGRTLLLVTPYIQAAKPAKAGGAPPQ